MKNSSCLILSTGKVNFTKSLYIMNENKLLVYISEMNIVFSTLMRYLKFVFSLAFFSENRTLLVLILSVLLVLFSFTPKRKSGA